MEQLKQLTKREFEALELIFQEYSITGVASLLQIRKQTVSCHKKYLNSKLNTKNAARILLNGSKQGDLNISTDNNKFQNISSPHKSVG